MQHAWHSPRFPYLLLFMFIRSLGQLLEIIVQMQSLSCLIDASAVDSYNSAVQIQNRRKEFGRFGSAYEQARTKKESACDRSMQLCINFQQIIFHSTATEIKLHIQRDHQ